MAGRNACPTKTIKPKWAKQEMASIAAISGPFMPGWETPGYALRPFAPELCLVGAIVVVLLVPFFARRRANLLTAGAAFIGLLVAFVAVLVTPGDMGQHFRGMLTHDPASVYFRGLLLLFAMGIVLLWFIQSSPRHADAPEFFTLLLGATLGLALMASTSNLLMMFLSVELASFSSYLLSGSHKGHRPAAEASLKYVLFGAVTAALMVYGLSVLYGLFGTLQLEVIARQLPGASSPLLLGVALVAVLTGIGFKLSAVPFHLWCPDVFEGTSVDVAAFLSVASKGAGMVLLLRCALTVAAGYGFNPAPGLITVAAAIGMIGAVTATVGNTGAFPQTNIKRLLAYSSIAHAGYMLCAASILIKTSGSVTDFSPLVSSTQPVLLYLAVYLFMNLGAFTVAAAVARSTGDEMLSGFNGLWRRSPVLAAAMAGCLFSFIGLPPVAGFTAKLNIMYALFEAGPWWWALAGVIAVNTLLSAFYYFRIIRSMYLESPPADHPESPIPPLAIVLSAGCAGVLVLMFLFFNPLANLASRHASFSHLTP